MSKRTIFYINTIQAKRWISWKFIHNHLSSNCTRSLSTATNCLTQNPTWTNCNNFWTVFALRLHSFLEVPCCLFSQSFTFNISRKICRCNISPRFFIIYMSINCWSMMTDCRNARSNDNSFYIVFLCCFYDILNT